MSAARVLVLPQIWATGQVCDEEAGRKAAAGERIGCAWIRELPRLTPWEREQGTGGLRLVAARAEPVAALKPQLAFYRKYTEAMLRRYMKLSMGPGREASLLGRELFPGKMSSYKVHAFDDVVIFVHDVDSCVARLGMGQQQLIRRIALQEYTQAEAAGLLGLSLRTVVRHYSNALDELTAMFLERGLLEPYKSCQ
jgi:hypothetical protein